MFRLGQPYGVKGWLIRFLCGVRGEEYDGIESE